MCSLAVGLLLTGIVSAAPTTQPLSANDQKLIDQFRVVESEPDKIRLIGTIAGKGDPRFVDVLAAGLRDDSSKVQMAAVRGLGLIANTDAVYELDAIASNATASTELRMAACEKLASIAIRKTTDTVIDSLIRLSAAEKSKTGRDYVAEKAAVEVTRVFKSTPASELQKLTQSGSDEVRTQALAEMKRRESGGEVIGAAKMANPAGGAAAAQPAVAAANTGKIPADEMLPRRRQRAPPRLRQDATQATRDRNPERARGAEHEGRDPVLHPQP